MEQKLIKVEDSILYKVEDLEIKVNSMKDQILRITRLIDQDNHEKDRLIKQSDQDLKDLEEKLGIFYQEEKIEISLFRPWRLLIIQNSKNELTLLGNCRL